MGITGITDKICFGHDTEAQQTVLGLRTTENVESGNWYPENITELVRGMGTYEWFFFQNTHWRPSSNTGYIQRGENHDRAQLCRIRPMRATAGWDERLNFQYADTGAAMHIMGPNTYELLTANASIFKFDDNSPANDTIERSSGSWVADGWTVGMTMAIEGSTVNKGSTSNRRFAVEIKSLTATVLTLEEVGFLTNEAAGTNATFFHHSISKSRIMHLVATHEVHEGENFIALRLGQLDIAKGGRTYGYGGQTYPYGPDPTAGPAFEGGRDASGLSDFSSVGNLGLAGYRFTTQSVSQEAQVGFGKRPRSTGYEIVGGVCEFRAWGCLSDTRGNAGRTDTEIEDSKYVWVNDPDDARLEHCFRCNENSTTVTDYIDHGSHGGVFDNVESITNHDYDAQHVKVDNAPPQALQLKRNLVQRGRM